MRILGLLLLISSLLTAEEQRFKFEGLLGSPVNVINNMNFYAHAFVPYDAVIIEVGAGTGAGTLKLAQSFPYGKVYAFEPRPDAFQILCRSMQTLDNVTLVNHAVGTMNGLAELWGDDENASLLRKDGAATLTVPCVVLDDWCERYHIDHVDLLRLDAGGMEWQILSSSPRMLQSALAIVIKTYLPASKHSQVSFGLLRKLLENEGFEMLAHWYEEEATGEATFIRKYMYDSMFR